MEKPAQYQYQGGIIGLTEPGPQFFGEIKQVQSDNGGNQPYNDSDRQGQRKDDDIIPALLTLLSGAM